MVFYDPFSPIIIVAMAPRRISHAHRRQGDAVLATIKTEPKSNPESVVPSCNGLAKEDLVYLDENNPTICSADARNQMRRSAAPTAATRATVRTNFTDGEPLLMEMRPQAVNAPILSRLSDEQGDDSIAMVPFKDIGAAVKACNDTLAQLQQLGVSHVASLPELVLIGDQSSGKSSLMSSIGYLNLPRSEGVCTRCPIHIRLSSHREWSAKISLHIDYAFKPRPGRLRVTTADPFPPWVRQPRETKEFKVLDKDHRDEIEETLRWAQVALLTPDIPHTSFEPGSGHIAANVALRDQIDKTPAKFSPNIISLEIRGPDLPDLSFFDLPGLIKSTATEGDVYLIKVVENLAKQYIRHPQAIILWAVPMTLDPDNSSTFQVIRDMKATDRTVGVMTKADLLQPGDHGQWLRMLEGHPESFQVGLGYYVTARPQGVSMEDAAKWEEAFFSRNLDGAAHVPNWSWPVEFSRFQSRTGVDHLRRFISERLGGEFARSLPHIKTKVMRQRDLVVEQLGSLPELPRNVEFEVRRALSQFSSCVKQDLSTKEFTTRWNTLSMKWKECIIGIKPKFTVTDISDPKVITIPDDDGPPARPGTNGGTQPVTPANSRKRLQDHITASPAQRRRLNSVPGTPTPHSRPVHIKREHLTPTTSFSMTTLQSPTPIDPEVEFQKYSTLGRSFMTIRGLRDELNKSALPGMPDTWDHDIYNSLAMRAVANWGEPLKSFIDCAMAELAAIFEQSLNKSLGSLQRRLIFKESQHFIRDFLEDYREKYQRFLMQMFTLETTKLYTINDTAFKRYHEQELGLLREARHHYRWKAYNSNHSAIGNFRPLSSMTEEEKKKRDDRTAEAT